MMYLNCSKCGISNLVGSNFLSSSEETVDKFREYFIVEVGDLRPQQGFAMSSPSSSFSSLTEYVNHQISNYKKLYQDSS